MAVKLSAVRELPHRLVNDDGVTSKALIFIVSVYVDGGDHVLAYDVTCDRLGRGPEQLGNMEGLLEVRRRGGGEDRDEKEGSVAVAVIRRCTH